MPKLGGKVAIVTGAAGGIGSATARLFAEEGAAVALVDLRAEALAALADEIAEKGGEVLVVRADVTDERDVRAAVDRLDGEVGRRSELAVRAPHRVDRARHRDRQREQHQFDRDVADVVFEGIHVRLSVLVAHQSIERLQEVGLPGRQA